MYGYPMAVDLVWSRQEDGSYNGYDTAVAPNLHLFTAFRVASACWDLRDVWTGHIHAIGGTFKDAKDEAAVILNGTPSQLWHPALGVSTYLRENRYSWRWAMKTLRVQKTVGYYWYFTLESDDFFYKDTLAYWESPRHALEYSVDICNHRFSDLMPERIEQGLTVYDHVLKEVT